MKLIEINRFADGVRLRWADGLEQRISSTTLRKNCPCAGCREARGDGSHATPLTPKKSMLRIVEATTEQETELQRIWAVGNYAIGMEWGDNHNSGIYPYPLLRQLGEGESKTESSGVGEPSA